MGDTPAGVRSRAAGNASSPACDSAATRALVVSSRPGRAGELLLAALGSCLSVGDAANAAAMGIELDDLRFELEGDIDLRSFLRISEDVRPGYDSLTCTAFVDADAAARVGARSEPPIASPAVLIPLLVV